MNCPKCNNELIWGADFSFEDYSMDGEGVVSNYSCANCETEVTTYLRGSDE